MYCTKCGTPRPDGATVCPTCGQQFASYNAPVPPPQMPASLAPQGTPGVKNYLVQSIIATLCCCLPFGIVAIVYASQVNTKLAAGDWPGAAAASKNAKMWSLIAIGAGIVLCVVYALVGGASVLTQIRNAQH